MQVSHLKTTAYHPQCNSQAEVANKTIAKYLAYFVDETALDWEVPTTANDCLQYLFSSVN